MNRRLLRWAGQPPVHIVGLFASVMAAVAIVAFAIGTLEYTKMLGRLLLTALMVAGYFLTTLAATGTPKDGAIRWLYVTILGFATLSLFFLLVGLWATPDSNEYWRLAASITFLALGMSLCGLALGMGAGSRTARALAWSCAALAAVLTVMTVLGIALEIKIASYWWAFVLIALCWLVATAALVAARLWRLRNRNS